MSVAELDLAQVNDRSFAGDSPRREPCFEPAIREWKRLLGEEHVLDSDEIRDRYARCTLPTSTRPRAIVRPSCTREVQGVVRIAGTYGTPLFPISRGKNWGYGDACAPTDGQVIVDLGRMNRIIEVNEELAYAVIEPGVTQGQMYEYLTKNNIPLILDVTGAGPDASIVGNVLQRGFGHTPYGDHFAHSCGLEVVLASGEIIETGFGGLESGEKAGRVFPWGVGPWIDGLFTQSNLGIVTKLGFWLMPRPERILGFAFKLNRDEHLDEIMVPIRWLRMHEVIRNTLHIANDLRVISGQRSYPWKEAADVTPLPDDVRSRLQMEAGIGAWNGVGALYGTTSMVATASKIVRQKIGKFTRVHFFDNEKLALAKRLGETLAYCRLGKRLEKKASAITSVFDLLCGKPSGVHLRGTHWRTRAKSPNDPSESGTIWLSAITPIDGTSCRKMLDVARPIYERHMMDPLLTLSAINARSICAIWSVNFDTTSANEKTLACRCYDALSEAFAANQMPPYRSGLLKNGSPNRSSATIYNAIKQRLDCKDIIAPKPYECGTKHRTQ